MFPELKNKLTSMVEWQPECLSNLSTRASILSRIREFFAQRGVLEVETPLLARASVTDPHIMSFETHFQNENSESKLKLFLQTSPEYAMKRLLAAGSGDIYQICKAFRNGESGSRHNAEFTILEWYRLQFDHHQLMTEVNALVQLILNTDIADRISYEDLFKNYFGFNPHVCALNEIKKCVAKYHIKVNEDNLSDDRDTWLTILLTHIIEPQLGQERPIFIYDYPAQQAALARIRIEEHAIGERFELYYQGLELANGYHELSDPNEQQQRFRADNEARRKQNKTEIPIDYLLLAALDAGLPNCAGVALGLDRLVMLATQTKNFSQVVSFSMERV